MEIDYKGANCVVIKTKKTTIVVDPTDNVKVKEANHKDAVILATQEEFLPKDTEAFVIDMPGEYEIGDVSIRGVAAKKHTDSDGKNSTMYRMEIGGIRFAIVGHVDAPISDDDLESLGVVDIAVIPVGGGGYTLDSRDAATIARQLSPKAVIPTHFADNAIKYEVPQEEVDLFVKEMGGAHEKVSSFKVKNGALPEVLTVVEISRSI